MPLSPALVGTETEEHRFDYDWKAVVLYALGVGARRDELDYVYEARGPKVLPTFAVVPAYGPVIELLAKTGIDLSSMIHGAQMVTLLAPIPPEGTARTIARVEGVYDLRRLGEMVVTTTTGVNGKPIAETEWSLLFRGEGGFGGRPRGKTETPRIPSDREPAWVDEAPTAPEQALLYRLSGDTNPLHADPEFAARVGFEKGPILHGLATYGFIARAIIRHSCGGDGDRLGTFSARFRKPVFPGETLRMEGFGVNDQVAVRVTAGERSEPVVTGCWAKISKRRAKAAGR